MTPHVIRRLRFALAGVFVCAGMSCLGSAPALAARKAVSAAEVNGTFRSVDGKSTLMLLSLGRGGLENPGFGLQIEFQTNPKKGATPLIYGGYGRIAADRGWFLPEETSDVCDLSIGFVSRGSITVKQRGSCDLDRPLTLAGFYKKTSAKDPVFTDVTGGANQTLFATFVGGVGSNTYSGTLYGSQVLGYKVELLAGQVLSLSISPSSQAYMSLFAPNSELEPDSGGMSEMTSNIDVPGLYEVKVQLDSPFRRQYVEYEYSLTIEVKNKR